MKGVERGHTEKKRGRTTLCLALFFAFSFVFCFVSMNEDINCQCLFCWVIDLGIKNR